MYEFDLIVGVDNSFDVFSEAWALWEPAILEYSAAPLSKSKTLKQALRLDPLPVQTLPVSGDWCSCAQHFVSHL